MKTKEFRVSFWYNECGSTIIKAKTAKQAELKVKRHLSYYGLDKLNYKCNDRDYDSQDAEEA